MKVKEVMTPNPKAIWLTESLVDAAQLMWQNDCGVLPVIKDGRKVIGMITDRDICMGTAIRDQNPSSISVEEVMSGQVYAVHTDDDIEQALETMEEYKVRRLPVINPAGELEGIVSMNDVVLKVKSDQSTVEPVEYGDVLKTYASICGHPLPQVRGATPTEEALMCGAAER